MIPNGNVYTLSKLTRINVVVVTMLIPHRINLQIQCWTINIELINIDLLNQLYSTLLYSRRLTKLKLTTLVVQSNTNNNKLD